MTPTDLIETYVNDVARRLPRKLRHDVGFELRALLTEELQGKADEAGRAADEAMTLALLRGFGRPEEVADRYRPASFTIIKPSETRGFTLAAAIGVALQWAVSLPLMMLDKSSHAEPASRLGAWWASLGIAAFWWPGFMVSAAIIARWSGHRWPRTAEWSPARAVDRDHINRPLLTLGLTAWAAGAALWIAMPWLSSQLPGVLPRVFAFDGEFLGARGWLVLPLWAGGFAVHALALAEGRWRPLTRRVALGFGLGLCALMVWFMAGGPIFQQKATDDAAKFWMGVTLLLVLADFGLRYYRFQARTPAKLSGSLGPSL